MTKKEISIGLIVTFLIAMSYVFFQFAMAETVEDTCLTSDVDKVFSKEYSLQLDQTYDFSEIFTCENWDEVLITEGPGEWSFLEDSPRLYNAMIFLKDGVALPRIDYWHYGGDSHFFFFFKNGKLISSPVAIWKKGFIGFTDYNSNNYIKLKRKDAVFKCVKANITGMGGLLVFELVE